MTEVNIFNNINEEEKKRLLTCLNAKKINFKKEQSIISNIQNTSTIGYIISGSADLLRYDFNGYRTILEKYNENDVFGDMLANTNNGELMVIATSDCEVLFMDYDHLINKCKKNCPYHTTIVNNVINILSDKVNKQNERIEILTKRSIREKLLEYFNTISKNKISKTFYLPFTFTDLADYLSIDRSSMSREIKNLKDEGFIAIQGKRITLLY